MPAAPTRIEDHEQRIGQLEQLAAQLRLIGIVVTPILAGFAAVVFSKVLA